MKTPRGWFRWYCRYYLGIQIAKILILLEWVNRADLARIKGVSTQYADLLEASGVDSVPEMAQRNAANLHAKMAEVNAARNLVRKVPALSQVHNWIEQAKTLPRLVSH